MSGLFYSRRDPEWISPEVSRRDYSYLWRNIGWTSPMPGGIYSKLD